MNLFDDGACIVGIRPEHVRLVSNGELRGRVLRREPTGADAYLDVETPQGTIVVRVRASDGAHSGDLVALDLAEPFVRRFDRSSGIALLEGRGA
jgi:ABC-type sugar transport system ATPase subunit